MLTGVVGGVESSLRNAGACPTASARCLDKGRDNDRDMVVRTMK
jgi:hypothetical protein